MIDFSTTELTTTLALYCLIGYLFVFFLFKDYVLIEGRFRRGTQMQWGIMFIAIIVLCVTCFVSGDFYHYISWCQDYNFKGRNHGEPIYSDIIRLLDRNYLLFRILIWGGGLILVADTCRRLKIDKFVALFVLFVAFYVIYSYARASYAMAVYYWGFSLLISDKKNFFTIIIGVAGVVLSYVFHHSMLLCILLTPMVLVPLKRKMILYLVFFCPLICFIVGQIFADYFAQLPLMLDDEYLSSKLSAVGSRKDESSNWKGIISNVFHYGRFFLPMYIILRLVYFKDVYNGKIPNCVKYLTVTSFYLMLISIATMFIGLDTFLFFFRILFMAHIPLSLVVAKLYQDRKISKRDMGTYLMFFLVCSLYGLLYSVYTTLK